MAMIRKAGLLICALLFLAGCKVELHGGLQESEANQMMAALLNRGIPADKSAEKSGFSVLVDKSQFGQAVNILEALGLPSQTFSSVGQVFNDSGLVASPLQERARLNYALSQELSRSIAVIEGVTKVNVNIADMGSDQDKGATRSAAVVVQMRSSAFSDDVISRVKQVVSFALPDIAYEDVGVVVSPVIEPKTSIELASFAGVIVDARSVNVAKAITAAAALFAALSLILGGKAFLDFRARRATVEKARA